MAERDSIEVFALNIAASPHPSGVYVEALRRASRYLVPLRGSDFAKITTPHRYPDNPAFYSGRILVWAEINKKGRWLSLTKEEDLPEEIRAKINIPEDAKPNYRVFNYVFDESKHTIYFEGLNEFGESLGPTTGRKLFYMLLSDEVEVAPDTEFALTLLPEEAAVDRIFAVPDLRSLTIRITRPNPDATDSSARKRIYRRLADANASRVETTYVKAAGAATLTPTPQMREEAELGAVDGFVKGFGYDVNGKKARLSTDAFPRRYSLSVDSGGSFIARLLRAIGVRR